MRLRLVYLKLDLGIRRVCASWWCSGVVRSVLAGGHAAGWHSKGQAHRACHSGDGSTIDLISDGVDNNGACSRVVDGDGAANHTLIVDISAGLAGCQAPGGVNGITVEHHRAVVRVGRGQLHALGESPAGRARLHACAVDGSAGDADATGGWCVAELHLVGHTVLDTTLSGQVMEEGWWMMIDDRSMRKCAGEKAPFLDVFSHLCRPSAKVADHGALRVLADDSQDGHLGRVEGQVERLVVRHAQAASAAASGQTKRAC